jgi:hypothetical protein
MPQARSSGSGAGSSSGGSSGAGQSRRSTGGRSTGSRSTGTKRTTRSSSSSAGTSARKRSSGSGASRSGGSRSGGASRSSAGAASAAQAAGGGHSIGGVALDPRVEALAQRIRKLNERIIEESKEAGEATLSSYEKMLKAIAGSIERGPGRSEVEWISSLATTQAKFIRDVTTAWTSAARGMIK